jgi:hypothetical protein
MFDHRLSPILGQQWAYNGQVTPLLANEAFSSPPKLIANILQHLINEHKNLVHKWSRETLILKIFELNRVERNGLPVNCGDQGVSPCLQHPLKMLDISDLEHCLLQHINILRDGVQVQGISTSGNICQKNGARSLSVLSRNANGCVADILL